MARKKERQLIIIEDQQLDFLAFLHTSFAKKVLNHPRIHFAFFYKGEKNFEDNLAKKFPVRKTEVLLAPTKKKSQKFHNLRLKLLRKTTLSEGLYMDRLYSVITFQNFVENVRQFPGSFYMNTLKGAFEKMPVIIVGAGPSLSQNIPLLKKLENKAFIIAGGSAISALSSFGIKPHLGFALDPNLEEYYRLKRNFSFDLPMVCSSRVHSGISCQMNGIRGYLRSSFGQLYDLWIEEKIGLKGDFIGSNLSSEALSVTTMALSLAEFLGFDPLILVGVDLAYTSNSRYATGVVEDEKIDPAHIDRSKISEDRIYQMKDVQGSPIYTSVKWIMERDTLDQFTKKSSKTFYNASGGLAFTHIPYKKLEEIHFHSTYPFSDLLYALINQALIPCSQEEIEKYLIELQSSLQKCLSHLRILKSNDSFGHKVLGEMELKEERAYQILFYDTQKILKKYLPNEKKRWSCFYQIVQRYLDIF